MKQVYDLLRELKCCGLEGCCLSGLQLELGMRRVTDFGSWAPSWKKFPIRESPLPWTMGAFGKRSQAQKSEWLSGVWSAMMFLDGCWAKTQNLLVLNLRHPGGSGRNDVGVKGDLCLLQLQGISNSTRWPCLDTWIPPRWLHWVFSL